MFLTNVQKILKSLGLSPANPIESTLPKPDEVQIARDYITDYWPKLQRFQTEDDDSLMGLPHPYLVPAHEAGHDFDFNEMYYWDSYFMIQGLLDMEHQELVEGILDNFMYLFDRYGVIPCATRTYLTGRSQPPLLTSFIFDVYHTYNKDLQWLQE